MKKHNFILLILFFLSFASIAQNAIKENASYQKVIHFDYNISKEKAIKFFLDRQGLDVSNTFTESKETSDESGLVHQRHQQFYKGIKVEFGTLITHTRNGNVISINAELYNPSSLNLIPSLNSDQAFVKALNSVQASRYLWEDENQAKIVNYQKLLLYFLVYLLLLCKRMAHNPMLNYRIFVCKEF